MTDKKPSTAEIMAMLRKKPGAEAPAPAAEAAPPAPPPAAAEAVAPAAETPPPAPAAPAVKPKGTADIMAAIRAKGATPAAPAAAAPTAAATAAGGPPAAKPKGTADIMAAIRAKGAAPAGASPAAVAPAAAGAPKAAAPVATGKSPAEMIQAMRAQAAGTATAAPAVPAKPKLPAKPAPAAGKAGAKAEQPRRSFFGALFVALCTPYYMAWTTLSVIGGFWGLGIARFMMPNTVLELPSKFKVGSIGDYPLGTVSEKYKAARAVWIVHTDSYDGQNLIYALLSVCTHLGCTPSWLDAEQKFKCPCHGSGFYINGINFEGPAPRPLERVGLTLGADGVLEVDKSIKFQEELGQWGDSKSFVKVS